MTPLMQDEIADESVFDKWADVYDAQPNPLLSLEERTLSPLLPRRADNIIDIGCGTGRWLARLEKMAPASLVGIDSSARMLERARAKVASTTVLRTANDGHLFSVSASQDLLLASFVLSYLPDLEHFATECARVMRPGASLFVSDMHPATAEQFQWKRSFQASGKHLAIDASSVSIQSIVDTFTRRGLELQLLLEPAFGNREEEMFHSAGRIADLHVFAQAPAIYIAKFIKPARTHLLPTVASTPILRLPNARVAIEAEAWMSEETVIHAGLISLVKQTNHPIGFALDLTGCSILPGLINAHDHLEFGLFPRLGRDPDAPPYSNAAEWAQEIQKTHRSTIDLYRSIPLRTRLWWGAIRNLLCGATTVCHHNPMYAEFEEPDFPVNVVSRFGWGHSLAFEEALEQRLLQTPGSAPFIIHAAEGIDEQSRGEVLALDRRSLLNNCTVLVHGVALTTTEIALINSRESALIACPTSNQFLFQQVPPAQALIAVRRLALGSDSSITADGDLLNEVQFMRVKLGLDETFIYGLVTSGAASVLRLHNSEGEIMPGKPANLVVVRSTRATPAATLCSLSVEQIELVVRDGRIFVASEAIYRQLPEELREGLNRLTIDKHQRWVRAPLASLFASAEAILGRGNLMLSGRRLGYVGPL